MNKVKVVIKKYLRKYSELSIQVKATIWFTICSFFQRALSSITVPIFTRLMNVSEYGLYSIYNSWYSIIIIFSTLNISSMLVNTGLIKFEKEKNAFIKSVLLIGNSATIITFFLYLMFPLHLREAIGLPFFCMLLMFIQMLFTPAYEIWSTKIRFQYNYKKLVSFTILYSVSSTLISIIVVVLSKSKGYARIESFVITQIVFYLVIYLAILWKGKGVKVKKRHWKFTFKFSVQLVPHYLANQVLARSDILMINYLISTEMSGIYSLGYSIAQLVSIFTTSLNNSFVPWLYQKLRDGDIDAVYKKTNCLLVLCVMINIPFIVFSPELLKIFATKEYYSAIYVIPPVIVGMYFIFVYGLFANIELFYERTSYIASASVLVAIVNIILNIIFIPKYGFIAAAYNTMLCYFLYCVIHYYFMRKVCKEFLNGKSIYDIRFFSMITIFQVGIMFIFLMLYQYLVIRYIFMLCILILLIINKMKVKKLIHSVFEEKNK